jgi:hypothetical protein
VVHVEMPRRTNTFAVLLMIAALSFIADELFQMNGCCSFNASLNWTACTDYGVLAELTTRDGSFDWLIIKLGLSGCLVMYRVSFLP